MYRVRLFAWWLQAAGNLAPVDEITEWSLSRDNPSTISADLLERKPALADRLCTDINPSTTGSLCADVSGNRPCRRQVSHLASSPVRGARRDVRRVVKTESHNSYRHLTRLRVNCKGRFLDFFPRGPATGRPRPESARRSCWCECPASRPRAPGGPALPRPGGPEGQPIHRGPARGNGAGRSR